MSNENENNQFTGEQANFGLPEGYFQRSASSIANKIAWEEEHKNFQALVQLKRKNAFTVPENYFKNAENKLELIVYPKLFSLDKRNDFTVPRDYFEKELTALSPTLKEQEHELSAFEKLGSIKKQNNFIVREDYFADNHARLHSLLKEDKSSGIFNLFNVKLSYAVAALLIVVLGLWTYNYYFKTVEIQDCGTIACIDKNDLVKTKNLENMDDEELYEMVDAKRLEEKINTHDADKQLKTKTDSNLQREVPDDLLDEL